MIEFARSAYDEIVAHARSDSPREVCGVLGGDYGDDRTRVTTALRADNAAERPRTEYLIDPEEQLRLLERIEDAGEAIAGFYHSHPAGPPGPSETDVERATWAGYSYVIAALDGAPFVGSWRWNADDERFEQELVRVVGPDATATRSHGLANDGEIDE